MRLGHKSQVPIKAIFAFPFLDLVLHGSDVGGELELLAVTEPNVVIWIAFHELYAFGFERCVEVAESFFEETWQEEERWALVEAVSIGV